MKAAMKAMLAILGVSLAHAGTACADDPQAQAVRLFRRLTGTPILLGDPRLAQMTAAIKKGEPEAAAAIATDDEHFYTGALRGFAVLMATRAETPLAPLDDFQAMILGAARDDLDARTLLSGDYIYTDGTPYDPASNSDYLTLDQNRANLKVALVKAQRTDIPEPAGLLTTRGWAQAHLSAGTNRRGIEYAFREFLCTPITEWRDPGNPDYHVRRDVDRVPGGNPSTYQTTCRSCHALMDAMGGAYARYDFGGNQLVYFGSTGIAPKMNRNGGVYPQGYFTLDDTWVNMATEHHNVTFGWRGATSGRGLREFGAMIASAKKFSACMTQRVFSEVCRRAPEPGDAQLIARLADGFEAGGYKLRPLFQKVAVQPGCVMN